MGPKMLSLRDNRLKFPIVTKEIEWNFLMKRTKIKRAMYNLQKLFNAQITPKIQGIQIVLVFTFLLIMSQTKRF
jgi:hypothetical protein